MAFLETLAIQSSLPGDRWGSLLLYPLPSVPISSLLLPPRVARAFWQIRLLVAPSLGLICSGTLSILECVYILFS